MFLISDVTWLSNRDSVWASSVLGATCLRTAKAVEQSFMRTVSFMNKSLLLFSMMCRMADVQWHHNVFCSTCNHLHDAPVGCVVAT